MLRIKVKNYRAPEFDIPLAGGFGLQQSWNVGILSHKRLAYSVSIESIYLHFSNTLVIGECGYEEDSWSWRVRIDWRNICRLGT
jgi:hypothetical protein